LTGHRHSHEIHDRTPVSGIRKRLRDRESAAEYDG
jgi:hypothetical protein